MHRSAAMLNTIKRQMVIQKPRLASQPACHVFINHRGIDTKRSIASLLYHNLMMSRIPSFLDNKNMKPGDKLFEHIDNAIIGCKIGVAVFSPRYCQSYFCLHELALMMESGKKVIPIFCDVKPSELRVLNNKICSPSEIKRFSNAIEEAMNTVGLAFDTTKGNWSDVVQSLAYTAGQWLIPMKSLLFFIKFCASGEIIGNSFPCNMLCIASRGSTSESPPRQLPNGWEQREDDTYLFS
ncbi:TIR domain-containing protein-like protein [Tanacetum coccineum]